MPRYRSHSVEFKRQVAQEFLGGETLHGLAKQHDLPRNLIRILVDKYEAGALDEDTRGADLMQEYEGASPPWSVWLATKLSSWSS